MLTCASTKCHCAGAFGGCDECSQYPTAGRQQRARSETNVSMSLCTYCLPYDKRARCSLCLIAPGPASGALCSSCPAASSPGPASVPSGLKHALENAAAALEIAVANLQHAARLCTPPPPLQQAGPGSSNDATPAPVGAECAAAPALFQNLLTQLTIPAQWPGPFEKGKAAGKGAGMDAAARVPVGARAAAVDGATAADAAEAGARVADVQGAPLQAAPVAAQDATADAAPVQAALLAPQAAPVAAPVGPAPPGAPPVGPGAAAAPTAAPWSSTTWGDGPWSSTTWGDGEWQ
jgi:hypothetical protein